MSFYSQTFLWYQTCSSPNYNQSITISSGEEKKTSLLGICLKNGVNIHVAPYPWRYYSVNNVIHPILQKYLYIHICFFIEIPHCCQILNLDLANKENTYLLRESIFQFCLSAIPLSISKLAVNIRSYIKFLFLCKKITN